jgi:hypothetical protein
MQYGAAQRAAVPADDGEPVVSAPARSGS